jgi:hypothetical protein
MPLCVPLGALLGAGVATFGLLAWALRGYQATGRVLVVSRWIVAVEGGARQRFEGAVARLGQGCLDAGVGASGVGALGGVFVETLRRVRAF